MSEEQEILKNIRGCEPIALSKNHVVQPGYVNAIQNSVLARWCLSHGETIPIPKVSEAEQRSLVGLVEKILAAKDADSQADTEAMEREIDRQVYKLYGLTEEEETAIERSLGLIHQTDDEEDAALLRAMEEADIDDPDNFVSEAEVMATLRSLRDSHGN